LNALRTNGGLEFLSLILCRIRGQGSHHGGARSAFKKFATQAEVPSSSPQRVILRRQSMHASPHHFFVGNPCQYYGAARFAVHAGCIPVCGNLFHHAVEMLLKGGLAKKRKLSLSELKKRGHKLKVLWREYKLDFPDPALKRHDKAISLLDKFEAIRYP